MKGGVGSWAASGGDIVVGALVVLNAVGNILDGAGAVLAGARAADGTFADALTHFARGGAPFGAVGKGRNTTRSEEHTSELQSHSDLVCRLLLEKKKKTT